LPKHQTYYKEPPLAPARVQRRISNKHNPVLYVDQELVEKSRNLGFNLSKTFENHLKHLITQFSAVNSMNKCNSTVKDSDWWAEPDLNPRPLDRKTPKLISTRADAICAPTLILFGPCKSHEKLAQLYGSSEFVWLFNLLLH